MSIEVLSKSNALARLAPSGRFVLFCSPVNKYPHEFRDITEEQWKSGLSRMKCAVCSQDYGDPIHCVATTPSLESNWPLVIAIEDCYIPQSAEFVVGIVSTWDDVICAATWKIAGIYADSDLSPERWN